MGTPGRGGGACHAPPLPDFSEALSPEPCNPHSLVLPGKLVIRGQIHDDILASAVTSASACSICTSGDSSLARAVVRRMVRLRRDTFRSEAGSNAAPFACSSVATPASFALPAASARLFRFGGSMLKLREPSSAWRNAGIWPGQVCCVLEARSRRSAAGASAFGTAVKAAASQTQSCASQAALVQSCPPVPVQELTMKGEQTAADTQCQSFCE